MTPKENIINKYISENEFKSYLEIGYQTGINFNKIQCDHKEAVDPNLKVAVHDCYKMTSDEFFDQNENEYDCIFIDGLHHADQVRKDLSNASLCLAEGGVIILHDSLPQSEEMQRVPREQKVWTGDVWRAVVGLKEEYPWVKVGTYRSDWGLTIIKPEGEVFEGEFENTEMSYQEFKENEVKLLNILD